MTEPQSDTAKIFEQAKIHSTDLNQFGKLILLINEVNYAGKNEITNEESLLTMKRAQEYYHNNKLSEGESLLLNLCTTNPDVEPVWIASAMIFQEFQQINSLQTLFVQSHTLLKSDLFFLLVLGRMFVDHTLWDQAEELYELLAKKSLFLSGLELVRLIIRIIKLRPLAELEDLLPLNPPQLYQGKQTQNIANLLNILIHYIERNLSLAKGEYEAFKQQHTPLVQNSTLLQKLFEINSPTEENPFKNALLAAKNEIKNENLRQPDLFSQLPNLNIIENESQAKVSVLFNESVLFMQLGNLQKAILGFRQITEKYPHNMEAWNNLGILLAQTGDIQEGLNQLKKGLEIHPINHMGRYNVGVIYLQLGSTQSNHDFLVEAEDNFLKAVENKPNFYQGWLNLATIKGMLKKYQEGEEAVRMSLKINPAFSQGWEVLGHILSDLNRTDEAKIAYEKAKNV